MVFRLVFALALVSTLLVSVSFAQVPQASGDRHPEPALRLPSGARVALPCDSPQGVIELVAFQADTIIATTAGEGVADSYGCEAWDESGPEHIYRLEVTEQLTADFWLADNVVDHDLILLSDCDSDSCVIQANTQISATFLPGTYYLVVDGYGGAAGEYELKVDTRAVGVPDIVCTGDGTVDLGTFTIETVLDPTVGNLFEQPNYVSVADCNDGLAATRGGERWYRITLAAADNTYDDGTDLGAVELNLTATPESAALDLALWLWNGCGAEAECLAFVDDVAQGAAESLVFLNDLEQEFTMYLAVDCTVPAGDSTSGEFTLATEVEVQAEQRSLGDIRSLFR